MDIKQEVTFGLSLTIVFLSLVENVIFNLIFVLLPFMSEFFLKDSYPGKVPEDAISNYSAYLEGGYRLLQCVASVWVSSLSDKLGRKTALLICLCVNIICILPLGLCTSFELALILRLANGIFAAVIPLTKSLVADISNDQNISTLYGFIGLGIGLAGIVGPLVSSLSSPAVTFGGLFDNDFFRTYPYFLPFLSHTVLLTITIILVVLYVPKQLLQENNLEKVRISSIFTNSIYLSSVLVFGALSVIQFALRLLFSLTCKSPKDVGGMGINAENINSYIQLGAGVFVLVSTPLLTPVLSARFGLIRSMMGLSFLLILTIGTMGILNGLEGISLYSALGTDFGIANSAISIFISYISICVGNSVSPEVVGTAVGFSQGFASFCRFIAVSCFGVMYGWSVTDGVEVAGAMFSYGVLIIVSLCNTAIIGFALSPSVEKKKIGNELKVNLVSKKA